MKSKINIENIKQFVKLELSGWEKHELYGLIIIASTILFNALILNDSIVAIISAICGILYTILAGKGKISCYLFGLTGTCFYSYLAFKNALFGNLLLYMGYYLPMQIIGIFQWKKHLKKSNNEIIKTKLSKIELKKLLVITFLSVFCFIGVLHTFKDSHPIIDGITTILSLLGMYLTVKRAIEQWIIWTIVNFLSIIMWVCVATSGQKIYSTIIMWCVYFILGLYFYYKWNKEIRQT